MDASQIRIQAQKLLRSGKMGNSLVGMSVKIAMPIEVKESDGRLHSWYVAVTAGNYIAGFFQFLPDGNIVRFSTFQRRAGELSGCPEAGDWLDAERIKSRAATMLQPDETIGEPYLTYDRSPDKLVWSVPLKHAGGAIRSVYVAGKTVYLPPPGDTYG